MDGMWTDLPTYLPTYLPTSSPRQISEIVWQRIATYVETSSGSSNTTTASRKKERVMEIMMLGAALLNLYLQANYTGPSPEASVIESVTARLRPLLAPINADEGEEEDSCCWKLLEVDGEAPYRRSLLPEVRGVDG